MPVKTKLKKISEFEGLYGAAFEKNFPLAFRLNGFL